MAALFSKLTVVIRFSVKPISLFLDLQHINHLKRLNLPCNV